MTIQEEKNIHDSGGANLIFIVVRGSVTVNEFIGDHYAEANRDVLGYTAYDYVEDFEKKVWEDVKKYANAHEDLYDKPRAFFITGHSLGGAARKSGVARL